MESSNEELIASQLGPRGLLSGGLVGSPLSCAHSASFPGVSVEGEGEPGFLPLLASNREVPSLSLPEWVTGNHYTFNGLNNYRAVHVLGELWKLWFLNNEFVSPKV